MAITINSTRENEDDQTVFFSIDDKKWHGDIPKDADPQEFLDAKEDTLKVEILRKQYKGADVPQLEDKTALESFDPPNRPPPYHPAKAGAGSCWKRCRRTDHE